MSTELCLRFPDPLCVIVSIGDRTSGALLFRDPLTGEDREDLHWYLDVYGAQLLGSHADREAERIASRLPVWGEALFTAVFHERCARELFDRFQNTSDGLRVLTICAHHPSVLALPWELLHDSSGDGHFLFQAPQPISVRRCLAGSMEPNIDDGCTVVADDRDRLPEQPDHTWRHVGLRVQRELEQRWSQHVPRVRKLHRRLTARFTRFQRTTRFGKQLSLLLGAFAGRPRDVMTVSWTAVYLGRPFVAAHVFGRCLSFTMKTAIVSMPGSSNVPGDQMIHVVDRVHEVALWGGSAVAFAGIHVVALYRKAFIAMVWHLLAAVSPGGGVPSLRWFVWRSSSACLYLGLFIGGTGLLWPYFRPGSKPLPLERLVRENAALVMTVCLSLVLVYQLWGRHIAVVNRDIWGARWKAALAILVEMTLLLAVAWLLVLARGMLY